MLEGASTTVLALGGPETKTIATEAADALRSLCEGDLPVCAAIRENDGVKALVALLREGYASHTTSVAAAALSQIADSDPASRAEIREAGGSSSICVNAYSL